MKTFKGHFEGVPILTTFAELSKSPTDNTIEFTENQILLPARLKNKFADGNIKHGATYTIIAKKNIDRRLRYQVVFGKGTTLRIFVDKWNEMKLKWIHKLYPFQKDATAATILAIVSIIMSLILGVLQLKGC